MSDVDIRMKQFRSLMEPALNIFPPYLIRDLEANGFFRDRPAPSITVLLRAACLSTAGM